MVLPVAKRGRPSASVIPELMREGELYAGPRQCEYCLRNFPRTKSLMAHRRIHLKEKPYHCTYPGCLKEFRQSGQLKTHMLRHSGEKPYACTFPFCKKRFVHSSRHCPEHPETKLLRDEKEIICMPENASVAEIKWFEDYTAYKKGPVKRKFFITKKSDNLPKRDLSGFNSDSSCGGFSISSEGSSGASSSAASCSRASSPSESYSSSSDIGVYPQERHGIFRNNNMNNSHSSLTEVEAASILLSFSSFTKEC